MFKRGDWVIVKLKSGEFVGKIRHYDEPQSRVDVWLDHSQCWASRYPTNSLLTPITKEVAEVCLNKAIG